MATGPPAISTRTRFDSARTIRTPSGNWRFLSEQKLQRKLRLPRRARARNTPECLVAEHLIGQAERRRVREVEEFRPELQVGALANVEVLEGREIQVMDTRTA